MWWMREPGNLAHLAHDAEAQGVPAGRLLGERHVWRHRTACGRVVVRAYEPGYGRTGADWIDAIALRNEPVRGWCLQCWAHAAHLALLLPDRGQKAAIRRLWDVGLPPELG